VPAFTDAGHSRPHRYGAVCEERLKTLKVDLQHVKGSALGENLAAHRENLQRAATEGTTTPVNFSVVLSHLTPPWPCTWETTGRSVFTSTVNDRFVGLGSDEAFAVKELDELLQDAQVRATFMVLVVSLVHLRPSNIGSE